MEDEALANIAKPAPLDRLDALGRGSMRRKPDGGPAQLTARQQLLVDYMINGCGHRSICDRIWIDRPIATEAGTATVRRRPQPHEPLGLLEAADLLRIKRRNARELMTLPIFKAAYNLALQRFQESEKAASLHTLVTVRDDPGLGKAADRKVRLQAAMVLADMNHGGGQTVNVNVTSTQLTAGIVIDMREDDEPDGRVIEHKDTP